MRVRYVLVALAVAATLSGCLQFETIITVDRDGSGAVEQTFLMNNEILAMLQGMASETSDEELTLLDVDELRAEAEAMGEGVRFVSAEAVETDWGQGYIALFEFDDINTLRVNQNPGDNLPDSASSGEEPIEENLTFELVDGTPATLVIRLPDEPTEPSENDDADRSDDGGAAMQSNDEMNEMLRQFYADMRMMIAVEVDGRVVSTNATYREGSRITLMDLDFNAILENPEATERLLQNEAQSVSDLQVLSAMVPGVRIETVDPVRIRFR